MKPFRLVTRCRPTAALTMLAGCGLVAILAGSAPAALAAVQAPQAPQARILNPSPPTGLTAIGGRWPGLAVLVTSRLQRRRRD